MFRNYRRLGFKPLNLQRNEFIKCFDPLIVLKNGRSCLGNESIKNSLTFLLPMYLCQRSVVLNVL